MNPLDNTRSFFVYVIGTEWIHILGIRGGGTNQMNDIISRNSCQVHCYNFFFFRQGLTV